MNYKLVALGLIGLAFLTQMAVDLLQIHSARRAVPENVKDVYDREAYERWLQYFQEKTRLSLFRDIATHVTILLVVSFDVYPKIANALFP